MKIKDLLLITVDFVVVVLNRYTNVESYNLKIADEDGYIEQELAPLESNQKVLRFGFSDLALVEKPNVEKSKESTAKVRVLV